MAYIPPLPDVPGGLGSAESAYQSKYGTAPYEESRRKAESRFSLMNILTGALSGLSAGPGLNPFYSAGRGFAASYGRRSAAQRAAQEYAMKMQSQEQRQQEHADLEAVRKKPPPPPKDTPPEKDPRPWFYQPKHWNDPGAEAQRRKAEHIPTGKGPTGKGPSAKAPAAPKPPKQREAVMKRIDLINMADPTNPEHVKRLSQIIKNPATPEEKAAAEAKIRGTYGKVFNLRP
jgi:hypothetical protein